ncbi:translation repressor RelB [Staphylococcus microti]|uniref:Translation repressor RelB n=1 Tax=Staphylococcus microti TaxID=569857 RepID=A0A0D6XNT5_9STAP|nr:DUF6290 family protein [Staphylococcus microti]KIX90454.1 translation repressor RelB [Staphylococcus microti]PNZ80701.1 translation repressor RelB [Staphylococcus microti]SUM57908.1 Uncharacterised protein [Staphylococcus microti]
MTTITVRLNESEEALFNGYSEISGQSISTLLKKALTKQMEDEYDLKAYKEAYEIYQKDTQTLSHADFKKELGF